VHISEKHSDHFLGVKLSAHRMESFLVDWVNTMMEYPSEAQRPFSQTARELIARTDDAITRLIKLHPEVFSALPSAEPPPPAAGFVIPSSHWQVVSRVQNFLKLAWDAPDLRAREWYIFKARDEWNQDTTWLPAWEKRILQGVAPDKFTAEEFALTVQPPPLTPFERVMWHFHRIAEKARHCANPECPAPYFFAAKKGQKYCTSKCSAPSQRDQKRRWWRENRAKGEPNEHL
jgi:hypothetical protein